LRDSRRAPALLQFYWEGKEEEEEEEEEEG
jgi:hypothetical protein